MLPRPAPRERSAALEARCAELRRRLEQRQYDALVYDITQPVRSLQYSTSHPAELLHMGSSFRVCRSHSAEALHHRGLYA